MSLKLYPNFLSLAEVATISNWLKDRPYTKEKFGPPAQPDVEDVLHYRNKNIDFHLEESVVRQIVYPKLLDLIPDPCPTHCAFLESHYPFSLHVDTVKTFDSKHFVSTNNDSHDRALLITLNESPDFQTVFFDLRTDDIDQYYSDIPEIIADLPVPSYDKVNDLGHLSNRARNFLRYYSLDQAQAFTWQTGMALSWPRCQLHCSSNFYNKGIKRALIMFF